MPDYDSSLPVRTEADGDVKVIVVDPDTTTQQLAVDDDGAIGVTQKSGDVWEVHNAEASSADEMHLYDTKTDIAPNSPTKVIDVAVNVGKVFLVKQFQGSCSGKAKIELLVGATLSPVVMATAFTSTAQPNYDVTFPNPIEVAAGDKVILQVTNKDKANADLYGWVNGAEIDA